MLVPTWPDFTAFCTSPIIMSTPHVDALPFWPKGASGVIPPLRSPEMTERDVKRHQRYVVWLGVAHRGLVKGALDALAF